MFALTCCIFLCVSDQHSGISCSLNFGRADGRGHTKGNNAPSWSWPMVEVLLGRMKSGEAQPLAPSPDFPISSFCRTNECFWDDEGSLVLSVFGTRLRWRWSQSHLMLHLQCDCLPAFGRCICPPCNSSTLCLKREAQPTLCLSNNHWCIPLPVQW